MKKEYIRPFLWGGALGAIVLLIVIFSAGWVVTSGSAQLKAKAMVTSALMDRLGPISVAQFMQDPNKEERLADLKKLDYWKRGEYVQKQGWATMPGEKEADSGLADECGNVSRNSKCRDCSKSRTQGSGQPLARSRPLLTGRSSLSLKRSNSLLSVRQADRFGGYVNPVWSPAGSEA